MICFRESFVFEAFYQQQVAVVMRCTSIQTRSDLKIDCARKRDIVTIVTVPEDHEVQQQESAQ